MGRNWGKRLERLRKDVEIETPCEECGHGFGPVEYEVVWEGEDDDAGEDEFDDVPEFCPRCRRQQVVTVVWPDEGLKEHPTTREAGTFPGTFRPGTKKGVT